MVGVGSCDDDDEEESDIRIAMKRRPAVLGNMYGWNESTGLVISTAHRHTANEHSRNMKGGFLLGNANLLVLVGVCAVGMTSIRQDSKKRGRNDVIR